MKANAGLRRFSWKHLVLIAAFLLLLTALPTGIGYLLYPDARDDHIRSLNVGAQQVVPFIAGQNDVLHFPSDQTVLLSGEYANSYLLVYGSQWSDDQNVFLYGSQADGVPYYWTAKITNGTVTEVWFSKHTLGESELHAYTYEYQRDHTGFIASPFRWYRDGWVDDSAVVGYYQVQS